MNSLQEEAKTEISSEYSPLRSLSWVTREKTSQRAHRTQVVK